MEAISKLIGFENQPNSGLTRNQLKQSLTEKNLFQTVNKKDLERGGSVLKRISLDPLKPLEKIRQNMPKTSESPKMSLMRKLSH